jgi:hypothetical protein
MASKAPLVYKCPCCGEGAVTRLAKGCRDCGIPLRLQGEFIAPHCYLYLAEEDKWVWLDESLVRTPWEEGWKRRPRRCPDFRSWTDKYPRRPTGLEPDKAGEGAAGVTDGFVFIARPPRAPRAPSTPKPRRASKSRKP